MLVEKTASPVQTGIHKGCGALRYEAEDRRRIGIASYPKDTDNLEQLIVCADDAMYQVKKNGKNDFAFYKKPEEETTDNTQ